jgi:5-methylcytosine-specific restriction endonuclease McrA
MSCFYCSSAFVWDDPLSPRYPTRDHKVAKSRGGKGKRNIVWACSQCNNEKADMTTDQFIEYLTVTRGLHTRRERLVRWRDHMSAAGQGVLK